MADVPDPPWWRRREEQPRDRKPLTRDAIVDAGLKLLERDGLQALSMRRLAQELGTGAASLYWHVGDKEELLALLLDRIVGRQETPEPDPERWQEAVKELGRSARRLMNAHRDSAQLSMGRVPAGPNSLPVLERSLAVFAASGLPPRVIAFAADLFALYVGAFAFEESVQAPGNVDELGEYFRALPPDRFPTLTRLADDLIAGDTDERFEFGLELFVRGLKAMASTERDADGER
jgi:AcrR family transcriptional regulator